MNHQHFYGPSGQVPQPVSSNPASSAAAAAYHFLSQAPPSSAAYQPSMHSGGLSHLAPTTDPSNPTGGIVGLKYPSSSMGGAMNSLTGALSGAGGAGPPSQPAAMATMHEEERIFQLVQQVLHPMTREGALLELSKRRETFEDLAPVLWHSFGTHFFYIYYILYFIIYACNIYIYIYMCIFKGMNLFIEYFSFVYSVGFLLLYTSSNYFFSTLVVLISML
jgi:hypothetical protein